MVSLQNNNVYLAQKYSFSPSVDESSKVADTEVHKETHKTRPVKNNFKVNTKKTQGILAGSFQFAGISYLIPMCISSICISKIKDIGKNLTDNEFTSMKNAFLKLIDETGLNKKGVKAITACEENRATIKDIAKKGIEKNFLSKFLPQKLKDTYIKNLERGLMSGNNAFFVPSSNVIIMPTEKDLSWACFHEMGHALNANMSKIGKALQKCRNLHIVIPPMVLLVTLLKNKKSDKKKDEGIFDKITTFIKDNAGKIVLLSFAPMLIEEGMASIKGGRLAKKMLNPELAKKVAKGNKIAYLTYLGIAGAFSYGVYMAKKVKDAVTSAKTNNKKA